MLERLVVKKKVNARGDNPPAPNRKINARGKQK